MSNWLNSHEWRENISSPLGRIDFDKFQSGLDAIVGVDPDGAKRWRLVWGQDLDTTADWDRYRQEWRPRYPAGFTVDYKANPATGVLEPRREWFGIPRYFIEALIPRVHRDGQEEAERAGVDPDGDAFAERRVIGPEYVTMLCITNHSPKNKDGWRWCCLNRVQQRKTCYGFYRVPDEQDIEALEEDFQVRVTSKLCRPDEIPNAADKQFHYTAWALDQAREAQKRSEELDYRRREILSTLKHWQSSDFTSKKNRFSLPGH